MNDNNVLNVLFSSDDNYAQHMGAAIYSLLKNNIEFEKINIFIVENEISDDNKKRLEKISSDFSNAKINWISFMKWKSQLNLNMKWQISISTYARLFISEMLPHDINRLLYLDCDMIVCNSLRKLWNTNLHGCVLGAVQDTISDSTKEDVGLLPTDSYFNAGLLLIDLQAWRNQNIGKKCLTFIEEHNGSVTHHDQGTLNGVLRNNWFKLHLENNLMTIHYMFSLNQIMNFYGEHALFYNNSEIIYAKDNPVILHYTPSLTTRPWVKNCKHPKKQLYWDAIDCTPWVGAKPQKDCSKWYVKLINWKYRNFKF